MRARIRASCQKGFTLLETMIAMTIMMIAFSAILMVESASVNTSTKAKQMNIVSMLAKSAMIDAEYAMEGKTFEEVKKEETQSFPEPYNEYTWTRKVTEIKFPNLAVGGGGTGGGTGGGKTNADSVVETITKLLTNYLSKAIRELSVTITWKKGTGEQSLTVSTYWVDLNHEFQLTE
jgi:general secretion pathway protein I